MRFVWVLRTLLSHWRRRPFQLLTLTVGLAVATALWSGVQALNVQARASYDEATAIISGDGLAALLPTGGQSFDQDVYVELRRGGWPVTPLLEGEIEIDGASYRLIGIDPVTLPQGAGPLAEASGAPDAGDAPDDGLVDFLIPPSLMLAGAETLDRLGAVEGAELRMQTGKGLPPLRLAEALAPDTLVTDIGIAQHLLDRNGTLSRLLLTEEPDARLPPLESVSGQSLRRVEPQESSDLERLTDSFHLNLTAFGFLSFLVGLFIVHSAIGLAFEQRRPMLRTLRACGVSQRALTATMLAELVALSALAGLIGVAAGYLMASALLPDVAASLRGLYGARVSGELALSPLWWLLGIAMSVVGALTAAGSSLWKAHRLPLFAPAQPHAWAEAQARTLRLQGLAALFLFVSTAALALFGEGLVAGFALMGAILVGAALLLPVVLAALLQLAERRAEGPMLHWFFADSRQQLTGLSLALMALLLALAVNVGVGTMVDSFRLTFTGWLDQRLASELYVGGDTEEEAAAIQAWLEARPDVDAVLPVWNAETRFRDWPVEVFGFQQHETYSDNWPLLSASPAVWEDAASGEAVLVSEQLARRFGIAVGDTIAVPTPNGEWSVAVGAVYSDYGNPRGQLMVAVDDLIARFPDIERGRFAVRADPAAVPGLMQALRERFTLDATQLVDQASLKTFSTRIFERTFAVTIALNALTLAVAGIALLTSLLTLSTIRLPQLAPLWAVGITRRRLAAIELVKALVLALMTALLALPLGLLVAWVLMAVINVEAFGWQLPLHLFPGQWLRLLLLALATALVAALWPAIRLRTTPPTTLLKVFADER